MSFFRYNFVSAKRINTITMKSIASIVLLFLFSAGLSAQKDSLSLLPDQNPNFRKSRAKYTEMAAALTQNEGQTVQQTYKAIDDVQAKKERRELRIARRQERRMARIQSGYWNLNPGWGLNAGWGLNSGWGYNGYNNYGPGWGFRQNYGYSPFYSPFNSPFYPAGTRCNSVNSVLNTALLGLSLWSIFGR
jgi:hypothetical protein